MKKTVLFVLIGILTLTGISTGCATMPNTVAVVNGVEISGDEYKRALNGFLAGYGLTEETMSATLGLSESAQYKNSVIDEMVLQELMLQYAKQNGLDQISAEDESKIESQVKKYLEDLHASFAADVESEGTLQGDAASKETEERFSEYIDTYAYTEENLKTQYEKQLILDRVYDRVMNGCQVTEMDVQRYYSDNLAEQRAMDKDDPDALYEQYINPPEDAPLNVYVPEKAEREVRYVKHILVQLPSDTTAKISELEASGNTKEAEKLKTEAMAALKEKADEVLALAQSGEDFDTLVAKYNEDPGMGYNPDGYKVYDGAPFDSAFLADALSLQQIGDISSKPVESNFGYHIIKFVSVPKAGPVPFSDIREDIVNTLKEAKSKQYWKDAVASWQESAQIEKHQFRSEA